METIITKSSVARAVYAAIPQLACVLPADIEAGLIAAREAEDSPRGRAVLDQLVRCVREKAANACPPLVVGVGIGGTFDKVASLAKRALMRPVDEPAADPRVRALEEELLEAVNATGVGPGGLGGRTTALAVRVATAPCHIAALPLAINMGCSAMRRVTVELGVEEPLLLARGEACDQEVEGRAHEGEARVGSLGEPCGSPLLARDEACDQGVEARACGEGACHV